MKSYGELLLTRERGKQVVEDLPDELQRLTLNFEGVEVASPSFLDEVIKGAFAAGAKSVRFTNASERTHENLNRLIPRNDVAPSGEASSQGS